MKLEHRKVLQKAYSFILGNLIVDNRFLSHFEQHGIFDIESVETILVS